MGKKLFVKVFAHVAGQDLRRGRGRPDGKEMVDDGMGHFVGQHPFMQIGHRHIDGVFFKQIPGAHGVFPGEQPLVHLLQGRTVRVDFDGHFGHFPAHVKNLLDPHEQGVNPVGDAVVPGPIGGLPQLPGSILAGPVADLPVKAGKHLAAFKQEDGMPCFELLPFAAVNGRRP